MVKRLGQLALVAALILTTALFASAQPDKGKGKGKGKRPEGAGFGNFGGSQVFLLTQKSVQDELKTSDEQNTKVKELADKQRDGLKGLRELSREERQKKMEEATKATEKAVAEILKPEQTKRLKQIQLQQQGPRAFARPETATALKLTDEQKDKVKSIQEDARKEQRELFKGGPGEETRKKAEELRKTTQEKLLKVLTEEQQSKWKELTGEPFKGEIKRPEFRPGRRPDAQRTRGAERGKKPAFATRARL
jgi:Spy/CpxP family protein refolding chaperone